MKKGITYELNAVYKVGGAIIRTRVIGDDESQLVKFYNDYIVEDGIKTIRLERLQLVCYENGKEPKIIAGDL